MDLYLLIYFFAGIVQDFVATLNVRFTAVHKLWPTVISSFVTVLIGMVVLYNILAHLDTERSIPAIIAYAAGIATGTFFGMKWKIEKK